MYRGCAGKIFAGSLSSVKTGTDPSSMLNVIVSRKIKGEKQNKSAAFRAKERERKEVHQSAIFREGKRLAPK